MREVDEYFSINSKEDDGSFQTETTSEPSDQTCEADSDRVYRAPAEANSEFNRPQFWNFDSIYAHGATRSFRASEQLRRERIDSSIMVKSMQECIESAIMGFHTPEVDALVYSFSNTYYVPIQPPGNSCRTVSPIFSSAHFHVSDTVRFYVPEAVSLCVTGVVGHAWTHVILSRVFDTSVRVYGSWKIGCTSPRTLRSDAVLEMIRR